MDVYGIAEPQKHFHMFYGDITFGDYLLDLIILPTLFYIYFQIDHQLSNKPKVIIFLPLNKT